jgi:hypothetical protein
MLVKPFVLYFQPDVNKLGWKTLSMNTELREAKLGVYSQVNVLK